MSFAMGVNTINDSDDEEMMQAAQSKNTASWTGLATIHHGSKSQVEGEIHVVVNHAQMAKPVTSPAEDSPQFEDSQSPLGKLPEDPLPAVPEPKVYTTPVKKRQRKEDSQSSQAPATTSAVATPSAGNGGSLSDSTLELPGDEAEPESDLKNKLMNDAKFAKGTKLSDLSPDSQETLKKIRRWRAVENSNKWHGKYAAKGVPHAAVEEGQEAVPVAESMEAVEPAGSTESVPGEQESKTAISLDDVMAQGDNELKKINMSDVRVTWQKLCCL